MQWGLVAFLVLGAMLSGCAEPAAPGPTDEGASPATMAIVGFVLDETLAPIPSANVTLRDSGLTTTTDSSGAFRFEGLTRSAYLVDVQAQGYENVTLTAEPEETSSLEFILPIQASLAPRHLTLQYHGTLECAFEAFIISPSCDSAVADGPVGDSPADPPHIFETVSIFDQPLEQRWATVVVDVSFDPDASPGLDGLRLVVRGRGDSQALGSYQKYGTFIGQDDFATHILAGVSYEGGDVPVEANATGLELQIFPHSHAYHDVCGLPVFNCTLGVGVATNVSFDLFVTIFYNEPAPAGWSFLGQPA